MEIGAIVIAAVGSTALFNFIQYLLARKDKKEDALADIHTDLKDVKEQLCRTQMLLLMADYPDRIDELMKVAQSYFVDLQGDWYISTIFSAFLASKKLPAPAWFKGGNEQ